MSVTIVTPVSVIPSHPDTAILDETIKSVRHHLPDAELMLCFDGVRAEQSDRRDDYDEFVRRVLWKADHDEMWRPVCPRVFDEHLHQIGMMRAVIDNIRTQLLLFVEQDTPLVTTEPIDWQLCQELLLTGDADIVRFSHEAQILDEHRSMVRFQQGDFVRTIQFSARPHLATVTYYKRVLYECFSAQACCFLEDRLYGQAYHYPHRHKLWIYHPDTPTIQRSYHTDGRAGADKYAASQVF